MRLETSLRRRPARTALALIAGLLVAGLALAEGWEKLGSRKAGYRTDKDTIKVTAKEGTFRQIKLRVRGAPVRFTDVDVHFANGDTQDVKMRRRIPAGGETRAIDLEGRDRVIEKVVFWYDTAARPRRRAQATVELWGR